MTDLGELRDVTIDLRRPWPPGSGDVYVGIRYRQLRAEVVAWLESQGLAEPNEAEIDLRIRRMPEIEHDAELLRYHHEFARLCGRHHGARVR